MLMLRWNSTYHRFFSEVGFIGDCVDVCGVAIFLMLMSRLNICCLYSEVGFMVIRMNFCVLGTIVIPLKYNSDVMSE